MKLEVISENQLKRRIQVLLRDPQSKCDYTEWEKARKGLLRICCAYGNESSPVGERGDFLVLEDWFEVRELCLNEVREGFVSRELLARSLRYLDGLPNGYFVLVTYDSVFASVQYTILLHAGRAYATVDGALDSTTAKAALKAAPWFAAEGDAES